MNQIQEAKSIIVAALSPLVKGKEIYSYIKTCTLSTKGDLTINCRELFGGAKFSPEYLINLVKEYVATLPEKIFSEIRAKISPEELVNLVKSYVTIPEKIFSKIEAAGSFINFSLETSFLAKVIEMRNYSSLLPPLGTHGSHIPPSSSKGTHGSHIPPSFSSSSSSTSFDKTFSKVDSSSPRGVRGALPPV